MQAVQLMQHGVPGRFERRELPSPNLGPGEVRVRVTACGVNRLDLWAEEGTLPVPLALPRILGGEIAGKILEVAPDVADWQPGDRVAVQSNLFCGTCEYCLRGDESICLKGRLLGVDLDGGFAEEVTVPARALVRIPGGLDDACSAALTLAGSTAMHMLTDRTQTRSSEWVLVMAGASGVGTYAIQIAKQLGARVIATGSTEAKREFAQCLGADAVVDSRSSNWPDEVRRITQKRGVDVIGEHVGGEVFQQCLACLARGGRIVTCGATAGRMVQMNLWPFFVKQQQVIGSYGRTRKDITRTLEWAAAGRLRPVIHETFPLERAPEALAALRNRAVLGKVLVRP